MESVSPWNYHVVLNAVHIIGIRNLDMTFIYNADTKVIPARMLC
jgi:hypothetical protein